MTDFNLVLSQVRQRLEILYQIVDELEAQGGGGGGTSDYTQLDNLPKLNSKTITGSHDGSYYGLADASTTYTKSEVDTALADKADKSTTYTKTEVDTALSGKADAATTYTKTETDAEIASEIVGAINDLDVAAVGGSTKYLTTISEANGLIDATAASPDTTPTTDSSKLITSGGVKTYVDGAVAGKIGLADIFGQGVRIQGTSAQHEDLNNYWTAGNYYILTAGDAGNTDNKPYDPDFNVAGVRARVLVFQFSGTTTTNTRCFQIYIPARTSDSTGSNVMYIRYRYISDDVGAWTAWYGIGGTALGPAPTLNMVNAEMRTAVEPDEDEPQDER